MNLFKKKNSTDTEFTVKPDKQKSDRGGKLDGVYYDDLALRLIALRDQGTKARDKHPYWNTYGYKEAMQECMLLAIGQHWQVFEEGREPDIDVDERKKEFYQVENIIKRKIKAHVAILTENPPIYRFEAVSTDNPEQVQAAKDMTDIYQKRMEDLDIEDWNRKNITQAATFGKSITFFIHDNTLNYPQGEDILMLLDPLACFWHVDTQKLYDKKGNMTCKFFGCVICEEKKKFEMQWGVKIKGKGYKKDAPSIENYSLLDFMSIRQSDSKKDEKSDYKSSKGYEDDIEKVTSTYILYNDLEEESYTEPVMTKEINLETGEPFETQVKNENNEPENAKKSKRKYPNGRLFILVGKDIVYDKVNPYDHNRPMFLVKSWDPVTGCFWDTGISHSGLKEIQKSINLSKTYISWNNSLAGNAVCEVLDDALSPNITREDIHMRPGEMIPVSKLGAIRPIQVQSSSISQNFNEYHINTQAADLQVGVDIGSHGVSKTNDPAIKVELLDEKTLRYLNPYNRDNEEQVLEPLIWMKKSNDLQFYSGEEIYFKTTDIEHQARKLIFSRELLDAEMNFRLIKSSTMPSQKQFLYNWLLQAKQSGLAIPDEYLLMYSPIPELVNDAKKWRINQEMMMQAQLQLYQIVPELQIIAEEVKQKEGEEAVTRLITGFIDGLAQQFGVKAPNQANQEVGPGV